MINEIFLKFLEYSANKNIHFINKSFYKYIKEIKKLFEIDSLIIKYKLKRVKKNMHNYCRSSFYIEPENEFIIENQHIGINIGKLYNENKIKPSEFFKKLLIPFKLNNKFNIISNTYIYFEIYEVYVNDVNKFKLYCLLW